MSSSPSNDFLAKAQAATQRVAASAAVQQNATPEQAKIVEELAQDRPTIHAAVTSFLSLVAARSLVTPDVQQQQQQQQQSEEVPLVLTNAQALQCSRILLKAINSTTLCATPTKSKSTTTTNNEEEYQLVAQLWNGLTASEQKPARFLGRRALRHAWADIQPAVATTNDDEKLLRFVEEFGHLLFLDNKGDDDDDSALIWDVDGGKKELEKRRERRQQRAATAEQQEQQQNEEEKKLPFIEELKEEEE
ncbi:expressed unknown protein [Seminavis robusta]|uniref:Uncharacterized protein n=1 Tax=Seminavis robusta TaxID=568900 RepID=A0A9N8E6R4_9STRA|nr:expressed unknown protein [Seminavis robusta]|eukprot:Sro710_g191170.1 n/a (248) ;mRNA; f:48329-49072